MQKFDYKNHIHYTVDAKLAARASGGSACDFGKRLALNAITTLTPLIPRHPKKKEDPYSDSKFTNPFTQSFTPQ